MDQTHCSAVKRRNQSSSSQANVESPREFQKHPDSWPIELQMNETSISVGSLPSAPGSGRPEHIFMDQLGRFQPTLHMRLSHPWLPKLVWRSAQTIAWKKLLYKVRIIPRIVNPSTGYEPKPGRRMRAGVKFARARRCITEIMELVREMTCPYRSDRTSLLAWLEGQGLCSRELRRREA